MDFINILNLKFSLNIIDSILNLFDKNRLKLVDCFEFSSMVDLIMNSDEVRIFGMGHTAIMPLLHDRILLTKERKPGTFEILLMKPNGFAAQIEAKRENLPYRDIEKRYINNLLILKKIKQSLNDGIDIRFIDYLPPYNMFILKSNSNTNKEKAEIFVHIAGWYKNSTTGRPLININHKNKKWYNYFLGEYKNIWDHAETLDDVLLEISDDDLDNYY